MASLFVLSYFGYHLYLTPYVAETPIPASLTADQEITGLISASVGTFNKNKKTYMTLGQDGWESIASLGQNWEDATLELIREGTGNPYTGKGTEGDTFSTLKAWVMSATGGGVNAPMTLVEITPRGEEYEATCYNVIPTQWNEKTKSGEIGQEYSIQISPFGPATPCVPTPGEAGAWTLAAAGGAG